MDKLVRDAWLPIFCMYESAPAPSWHEFKARFGQHLPESCPMHLRELTGQELQKTLKRMRAGSAAGCDGWRVDEMRMLPIPILERLAFIFRLVESTGEWPRALTVSLISLISKGEGSSPPPHE